MGAMRFDGAKADATQTRDFNVGVAERDQPQHLLLSGRESERRVPRLTQPRELDTQRGLEIGLTAGDRAYPREQLSRWCRLEQVAPGARGKHGLDLDGIPDRSEDQDRALSEETT